MLLPHIGEAPDSTWERKNSSVWLFRRLCANGTCAHSADQTTATVLALVPFVHLRKHGLALVHGQLRAVSDHIQFTVRHHGGNFDNAVVLGSESGHLEVDPDQAVFACQMSDSCRLGHHSRVSEPPAAGTEPTAADHHALVLIAHGPSARVRFSDGTEALARAAGRELQVVCGDEVRCNRDAQHAQWQIQQVMPRRTRAVSKQCPRARRTGGRQSHHTGHSRGPAARAGSVPGRSLPRGGG